MGEIWKMQGGNQAIVKSSTLRICKEIYDFYKHRATRRIYTFEELSNILNLTYSSIASACKLMAFTKDPKPFLKIRVGKHYSKKNRSKPIRLFYKVTFLRQTSNAQAQSADTRTNQKDQANGAIEN
jgi:hypothetical protein